jgi:hypothetical protein
MYKAPPVAALALAIALAAAPLLGDSTKTGDFTIHTNAFSADILTPEIAQRIGFVRDKHRGILNVTVVEDRPRGTATSGLALVEAQIVKPEDHKGPIPMREIRDGGAISYMGEFLLKEPANLDFEIRVRPAGAPEVQTIRMSQELFVE